MKEKFYGTIEKKRLISGQFSAISFVFLNFLATRDLQNNYSSSWYRYPLDSISAVSIYQRNNFHFGQSLGSDLVVSHIRAVVPRPRLPIK